MTMSVVVDSKDGVQLSSEEPGGNGIGCLVPKRAFSVVLVIIGIVIIVSGSCA